MTVCWAEFVDAILALARLKGDWLPAILCLSRKMKQYCLLVWKRCMFVNLNPTFAPKVYPVHGSANSFNERRQ
jgi:hypothetical protein